MLKLVNNQTNLATKTPNGSLIPTMVEALIVREVQNLTKTPSLDSKQLICLERLLRMSLDIKRDAREDYRTYLLKNGLKGVDLNDPAVKRVMDLLMDTPQIED